MSRDFLCAPLETAQFAPLRRRVGRNGNFISYLDSAASALCPDCVAKSMFEYETTSRSNAHRAFHTLAEESTCAYEDARGEIASFLNTQASRVIFTKGTTDSLNMVAMAWGDKNVFPGDSIVVFEDAHHANILPWMLLAKRAGARIEVVHVCDRESGKEGVPDELEWERALSRRPSLVALTHVGNVTGRVDDIARRAHAAHQVGACVVLDCAQSGGHMVVDPEALGVDFAAFSAHKMYGPMGIGVLWCAPGRIEEMSPCQVGGGMVRSVTMEGFVPLGGRAGFEAGTPAVAAAVGFAEACRFLRRIGMEKVEEHAMAWAAEARMELSSIERVRVVGEGIGCGIVSFVVDGVHPHDVAQVLADDGIAVRAGQHCAMPLHGRLGLAASVRASAGLYSSSDDIGRLCEGVELALRKFGG